MLKGEIKKTNQLKKILKKPSQPELTCQTHEPGYETGIAL
jgi:hypothetical protein